jgi:hypothetical protein
VAIQSEARGASSIRNVSGSHNADGKRIAGKT